MDLDQFDTISAADEGATLTVQHPTKDEPLLQDNGEPVTIRLLGQDSKRWKKFVHQQANKRIQSRKTRQTAEEIEAENIEGWTVLTVGWSGIVMAGVPLDCTPANVRMVYARFPFIREQVVEFVTERANFLREQS